MRSLINFFSKNSQIIFFFLIFYGLSITIFLEEINKILIDLELRIFEIYRVLIILFSLAFFFTMRKKINLNIISIILISFIFIFNALFGKDIEFDTTIDKFYHILKFDDEHFFLNNKIKFIIINLFNITLPLIVLSFCKGLNFEIQKFKLSSFILGNIFLYLISFLMIYKFIFSKFGYILFDYTPVFNELNNIDHFLDQNGKKVYINTNITFVNVHSLLLILDIYFVLLIDRFFLNKESINIKNILNIFLIIFCFILSNTSVHFLICFISFTIYLFYFNKNVKYYFVFFIIIFFIIFLLFQNIFHSPLFELFDLNLNKLFLPFKFTEPGSFAFSIYIRMLHIKFFLFHSTNLDILIGNNIFVQNIYTYPHNLLVDIFICSGFIGLLLFVFIFIRLLFFLKNKININNFFFLNIFIQSFIFSNLSGFFFTNIIFNIALAACFCFFKENASAIIKNS